MSRKARYTLAFVVGLLCFVIGIWAADFIFWQKLMGTAAAIWLATFYFWLAESSRH